MGAGWMFSCFSFGMLDPKSFKITSCQILIPSFLFSVDDMAQAATAAPLVAARRVSNLRVWATLRMLQSTRT